MPLRDRYSRSDSILCTVMSVVAAFLWLLGLVAHRYRTACIIYAVIVTLLVCAAITYLSRRRCNECTIYAKAVVMRIWEVQSVTHLLLHYTVFGQTVDGEVTYHECYKPTMGQVVGVYYAEHRPAYCMLKLYKDHKPGWTKMTEQKYKGGIPAFTFLAVLFLGISLALLLAMNTRYSEYVEVVPGVVVDYEEQYNSHTGSSVPGTYQYSPVIEYTFEGVTYQGRSLQLQMTPTYSVGDSITVRINPSAPDNVIIVGDYTSILTAVSLLLLGLALLAFDVRHIVRMPKVLNSLVASADEICFL